MRCMKKKIWDEWKELHERLLPGYVFIKSNCVKELYMELGRLSSITKMLGKDENHFTALSSHEVKWLRQIMRTADGDTEVPISQVSVSEDDVVTILSEPLKDVEGQIKKINLHRQIAEIEVDFMNPKMVFHLGIEMVKKSIDMR